MTHEKMEAMSHEKIKEYIMSFPPKTKLVRILDACLTRTDIECLFDQNGWLCGDVSNIFYILKYVHSIVNLIFIFHTTFAPNYRS